LRRRAESVRQQDEREDQLRLQRFRQRLRVRWTAGRRAGGRRSVYPAAQRDEHLAAVRRRLQLLLPETGRRGGRLLVREARRERFRHDRSARLSRYPEDRLPPRNFHWVR